MDFIAVLCKAFLATLATIAAAGAGARVLEEGAVPGERAVGVVPLARREGHALLLLVVVEALAHNGLGRRGRPGGQGVDEEGDAAEENEDDQASDHKLEFGKGVVVKVVPSPL